VGLLLALGPAAAYQLLHLETTSSLSLTLPVEEEKEVQVLFKDETGQWQTADYRMDDGCVRIQIDVGRLAQGRTLLLINPPPTLEVNDTTPPQVRAVVVDGQARTPAGAAWDLGSLRAAPSRVVVQVEDGENALRLDSATFELDGQRFSAGSQRVQARAQGDKAAQWGFSLPRLSHGAHTLRFRVADGAPEANVLEQTMTFTFVDFSNRALATFHAALKVDSNFPSYPSLAALQDGFVDLDGISCGNDVSWASAETEEPHWVEIGLPEPQRLHEMTIYWAHASKVYRTSQRWEVQAPDGGGWRTVYRSPDPPIAPTKFTRCRFDPVVTDRLRLWQPARSGSEERPNLLWLGEIEVR
jgi:hypothetical protein